MSPTRCYITQREVVTSLSNSLEGNIAQIVAGQSGVRAIDLGPLGPDFPVTYAGSMDRDCAASIRRPRSSDYLTVFSMLLRRLDFSKRHFDGVFIMTHAATIWESARIFRGVRDRNCTQDELFEFLNYQNEVFELMCEHKISVPVENVVFVDNTCTSGLAVCAMAADRVRSFGWKRVLVAAIDLTDYVALCSLNALGALSTSFTDPKEASRPFDTRRDGFVKSDGAAMAVIECESEIEKPERALEILGCAQTSDAYRLTDGRDDARGAIQAMRVAMQRAAASPKEIAFVKAHGTSTQRNDANEALAIKSVFGDPVPVPVTSLKGHLGHVTDSSGLVETLIAGEAFLENLVLPTLNFSESDLGLPIVSPMPLRASGRLFLSNAFGFGGNNACMVVGRTS